MSVKLTEKDYDFAVDMTSGVVTGSACDCCKKRVILINNKYHGQEYVALCYECYSYTSKLEGKIEKHILNKKENLDAQIIEKAKLYDEFVKVFKKHIES